MARATVPPSARAKAADRTSLVLIDTDPLPEGYPGGAWWDVPVAEVSESASVQKAHKAYVGATKNQRIVS